MTIADTESLLAENQRLKVLLEVGQAISSLMELDELLLLIARESARVLKADRCTLFLLDEKRGELWSKVAMGEEKIRLPKESGIAGLVVTTGETLIIDDPYSNPHFNPEIDKRTGYHTRSLLCGPMRDSKGEVLGVFQVLNKLDGGFQQEDKELLEAVAAFSAIAIENARLYAELKKTFHSFIETLAATIDARHHLTAGHSHRVAKYTVGIAREMGLPKKEIEILRVAAFLHDYGKIGIPDSILAKPGRLTEEEHAQMKRHPALTKEILSKIYLTDDYKGIPGLASTHHEKLDGSGYPFGLDDGDIPLGGRIMAVADVFDAVTSKRDYREGMPYPEALELLRKEVGKHFDPEAFDAFERYLRKELADKAEQKKKPS
jgi:HD-GYP domain-containing protein (c-di-GMP phosphodiesterase class II)